MRVLVVPPGPAFSVADVYRGWVKGLRANGVEVTEYPFDDRLWISQHFHIKREGEWVQAMPFELATLYALEPLGSWIYETDPDLVLFVTGFWIRSAPLELIRKKHRVALLFTESPYEDDTQLERAQHADVVLLNDPTNIDRFREACPTTMYVPHSYDPEIHKPGRARAEMRSDLCVIGTGYESRVRFLEQMDLDGVDLALLGNWESLKEHPLAKWVRSDDLDVCVNNADAVRWYNSCRASLNLYRKESNRPDLSAGWSMGPREVELAASATFFLTEERPENRAVLPMVPTVEGPGDASEKLRWYLDHPRARRKVATAAREAVSDFTFQNRAAALLRLLQA